MRYLSVCSGIEAASVAWESLGWTPVGFAEIERFPSEGLAVRFPGVRNYGDMTRFREWDIDRSTVDVIVGGTPCQSFSVAGLRKGLDDPRGNLALTFLAMVDHYRPEWVIWENVPGVLSSNGGRDFGSFLGALGQLGYGFSYRVLDAQYFGVPQRRRRVFVIGHSSGDSRRAGEVLFEPESLRGNPAPSRKAGQDVTSTTQASTDGDSLQRTVGALCANTHPGSYSGQDAYTGHLIPVMYEHHPNDSRVTGPVDESPTVAARWGTGGGNTPLVRHTTIPIQDVRPIDKGQNGMGIGQEGDPSYTLDKMATQGVAHTYPINTLTIGGRPDPINDLRMTLGIGNDGDPQYTLLSNHSHAVAHTFKIRGGCEGGGKGYLGQDEKTYTVSCGQDQMLYANMVVRRLTPVECERLQGFPDGWTDVRPDTPDGPRYKAIGNSMAVPVMRWIGQRIQAVCK